jgi:glutathione S-transferase
MTTSDLAYPATTVLLSALFVQYLAFKVAKFRKLAKQEYPTVYATKEECSKDRNCLLFNCAQRAHLNTLENYPNFLLLMGLSSLSNPKLSGKLLDSFSWIRIDLDCR